MRILFTRLTNERHALEIVRDNGTRERVELETKSFLFHDLVHYALESSAGLHGGVWGLLASGTSLAELSDYSGRARELGKSELGDIELVTGPLTALVKGRGNAQRALDGIAELRAAENKPLPPWLTPELLERAGEQMHKLLGHFRATPFGQAMELSWP
jgi:hypothetical protein